MEPIYIDLYKVKCCRLTVMLKKKRLNVQENIVYINNNAVKFSYIIIYFFIFQTMETITE